MVPMSELLAATALLFITARDIKSTPSETVKSRELNHVEDSWGNSK
jgi:hypothetical protein